MGAKVLVTGGAGYIGAHACKALARAGHTPIAFDSLVYGHEAAVRWGPLETGDIRDSDRLNAVFETYRPDAVMHFAAFAYVGESVTDPGKYYDNNVAGSLTLLDAMRRHDVHRIVFSSSCATYGIPMALPITEDSPQAPINPYGQSKLIVERILSDYGHAYDLQWVALRYFNAAGADEDGEIGESHDPETHLIPLILDAALGVREAVTVFGQDYDTPDGTCIRDYIHVADLADAHVLALASLLGGGTSRAYNLGTGTGHSVRDVIAMVEAVTDRVVPVVRGARREGDPAELVASANLAGTALGWVPERSSLRRMVETAWAWQQSPKF